MTREELEEKLAPWAQAGYEAYAAATGQAKLIGPAGPLHWDRLTLEQKTPWLCAADAVLEGYDDEWPNRRGGL